MHIFWTGCNSAECINTYRYQGKNIFCPLYTSAFVTNTSFAEKKKMFEILLFKDTYFLSFLEHCIAGGREYCTLKHKQMFCPPPHGRAIRKFPICYKNKLFSMYSMDWRGNCCLGMLLVRGTKQRRKRGEK